MNTESEVTEKPAAEFDRTPQPNTSDRGELNDGYAFVLDDPAEMFGPEYRRSPSEGKIAVTVRDTDSDTILHTSDHDVAPGKVLTISTDQTDVRLKLYGTFVYRHSSDNVVTEVTAAYSLDYWDTNAGIWREVQRHSGTNQGVVEEDVQDVTVRVVLYDAPGQDAEADLKSFMAAGMSPAEALDYWIVEYRQYSQAEWADIRDRSQQAISKNLNGARQKLVDEGGQ